jgi:hypothetical protein
VGVLWGVVWQQIEGGTASSMPKVRGIVTDAVGLTPSQELVTCLVLFLSFNPKDKPSFKTLEFL